jgi:hypothetical protein
MLKTYIDNTIERYSKYYNEFKKEKLFDVVKALKQL